MAEKRDEKKGQSLWGWLVWWNVDTNDVQKQVDEYDTLRITQSARGVSFLAILFSIAVNVLVVIFLNYNPGILLDAVVFLVLGIFILKGHRWAMIGAMILWTFEKGYSLLTTSQPGNIYSILIPLIWWSTYMHAFWEAFKIEQVRAKIRKSHGKTGHLDELEKLKELKDKGVITEEDFISKKRQILGL